MQSKIKPSLKVEETKLFSTRLKVWNQCKRKHYYNYIRNMEPDTMHTAFYVGSSFHYGAMLLYQGKSEAEILKGVQEFQVQYKRNKRMHPEVADSMETYDATGLGMVLGYCRRYRKFSKTVKVVAAEQSFEVLLNVDGRKVPFIGTVDLMYNIDDKATQRKGLWLEDHKTAASIMEDTISVLPFNMQMCMYPAIVTRALGVEVSGMVYSIVKKPAIRLKKNETVTEFIARIRDEYVTKPDDYFYQEFVEYNPGQIKRGLSDVVATARDMLRWYDSMDATELLDANSWPRNEAACFPFGFKRENRCPYFVLCRDGEKAAGHTLQYYTQRSGTERGDIITRNHSDLRDALLGRIGQ